MKIIKRIISLLCYLFCTILSIIIIYASYNVWIFKTTNQISLFFILLFKANIIALLIIIICLILVNILKWSKE